MVALRTSLPPNINVGHPRIFGTGITPLPNGRNFATLNIEVGGPAGGGMHGLWFLGVHANVWDGHGEVAIFLPPTVWDASARPSAAQVGPRSVHSSSRISVSVMPSVSRMSSDEKRLVAEWHKRGKRAAEVARLLGRDKGTISRHFAALLKKGPKIEKNVGRSCKLTPKVIDRLVSKANAMIDVADAKWQVTAAMIKKSLKLSCSTRLVLDALHSRGIYMHPLREKPVRTDEDVAKRFAFAQEYPKKPMSFWSDKVHAYLDNKFFPVYLNRRGRDYAAKRAARGTFRSKGQGLAKGHVKPRKNLKFNTGAKSIQVCAAISAKRVLLWHVIKGPWNADKAADMYRAYLAPALEKAHGKSPGCLILEDNDPSGYKSSKGVAAKRALKLKVLSLPPRSPDLNPLDYGFWAEVNRRMRLQEQKFHVRKREAAEEYAHRLRRTATRIPPRFLKKLVQSLKRRCEALRLAEGGHFEE